MMMISLLTEPCRNLSWEPPCPPDGITYPSPIEPLLTYLVAFAVLAIGVILYETTLGRKRRNSLTLQNARQAAQRISSALRSLPLLQNHPPTAICKSIATDLLFIIDYNLFEITRYWVYERIEPDIVESVHTVCHEALRLRRPLERARFFLSFKPLAVRGQGLTMEAAARYVSVFTPALRQLHEKHSSSRDVVPIFEIDMPNRCEN